MNTQLKTFSSVPQALVDLDYILLDGSGSMMSKWWPMLGAIDTYIAGIKNNISSRCILQVFDTTDREYIARDLTLDQWRTFADEPIGAHYGGTPLWDAIFLMGRRIRDLDPQRASILIVTDGENSPYDNQFCDETQAAAVLEWLRAKGFQVTFFGCDFDNDRQARALGANPSNTIGVQKRLLSSAAETFAAKRTAYTRFGTDINFTEDERTKFGGFLSGPSKD